MTDFRYQKDDKEIEAFQMTKRSRYLEKDWPDWMDARWLMTIDNEQWLDHSGNEQAIPPLGWICRNADGSVSIRGAMEMEEWAKVVKEPEKEVTPPADGMTDESHLAAIYPQHVPEGKTAEDYKHTTLKPDNSNIAEVIDQGIHQQLTANEPSNHDGLLTEVVNTLEMFVDGEYSDGIASLKKSVSTRVTWCNCVPGQCAGDNPLGCRKSSPLL